ncbi:MAG TPA: RdgB/HAM1 family non-canonical purine NTP pyrophosphatase [Clostridia bacterium]|nr:RdgB/HAM1 family non-canonical purine NTP pyrophosphatase [Clostridia bacterium]
MEMIAATNNSHKLEEIRAILKQKGIEVKSMADVGLDIEIEENGDTFIDNALIKAREVFRLTGKAAIADDSGLEVDALNGEPGVKSARYSGEAGAAKDVKNNEKLKKALRDIPDDKRGARFCSAIAAVFPNGKEITAEGYVYGKIGYAEKGERGFGYDPLFIVDGYGRTMAEIDSAEKNNISHRANALKEFVNKLK